MKITFSRQELSDVIVAVMLRYDGVRENNDTVKIEKRYKKLMDKLINAEENEA